MSNPLWWLCRETLNIFISHVINQTILSKLFKKQTLEFYLSCKCYDVLIGASHYTEYHVFLIGLLDLAKFFFFISFLSLLPMKCAYAITHAENNNTKSQHNYSS